MSLVLTPLAEDCLRAHYQDLRVPSDVAGSPEQACQLLAVQAAGARLSRKVRSAWVRSVSFRPPANGEFWRSSRARGLVLRIVLTVCSSPWVRMLSH